MCCNTPCIHMVYMSKTMFHPWEHVKMIIDISSCKMCQRRNHFHFLRILLAWGLSSYILWEIHPRRLHSSWDPMWHILLIHVLYCLSIFMLTSVISWDNNNAVKHAAYTSSIYLTAWAQGNLNGQLGKLILGICCCFFKLNSILYIYIYILVICFENWQKL